MRRALGKGATFRPRRRRQQEGAAAVEFALVLPILLLIVFGIIAYGFIFAAQLSMNSAARDASRAGVVQPLPPSSSLTCQAIAQQAKSASPTVGLSASKISVTVTGPGGTCTVPTTGPATGSNAAPCTGSGQGAQVVVLVTYDNVKVPVPIVPIPGKLTATGSFQCEYS
jgi:Flp pilus assembly protein TadG